MLQGSLKSTTLRGASSLRIIVLGYIVRGPIGGLAWHHLQYVLGLSALGHEVCFVEDSDEYASCYDPVQNLMSEDPGYGLEFAAHTFNRAGVGDKWVYYDAHTSRWRGPRAGDIGKICKSADVVLNVSGVNPLREWTRQIPVRALIDTDPVFTQIKHLVEPSARERAEQHTHFFTFGENFAKDTCTIPDDHFPWKSTRQPVFLDAWPVVEGPISGPFTTVMQWDSYKIAEYNGVSYEMKSASFGAFRALPRLTRQPLELALGSPSAPRDELREHGWLLRDPLVVTRDPWTYQDYIQMSKAEFSVAKHGYVVSNSGWFSERSAAYLASGRPVVVQETGFSEWLPVDRGIISFKDRDEALAGIEEINGCYQYHCESARAIAAEYFDSRAVLSRLLDAVMDTTKLDF